MTDLQSQVNERVHVFVSEITELARQAAYGMLASALDQEDGSSRLLLSRGGMLSSRRKGAKRTSEELGTMADAFIAYITEHPGQRMENIAKELGYTTQELTLPVKKLLATGKIRVEGQKRATSYFAATPESDDGAGRSKTKTRGRPKTKQARRKKA